MKQKNKLLSLLLLLVGCATPYQEEGFFTNGYSNDRLAEDIFVITYHANEMTKPDDVLKYALRQCSKVTQKNGYRYFTVLETIDYKSKKKVPGLHYPSVQMTIKCFHDTPQEISEKLFKS